jgi:hypothetical protein
VPFPNGIGTSLAPWIATPMNRPLDDAADTRVSVKVSDRTRTGDRLDHNSSDCGRLRANSAFASGFVSPEIPSLSLSLAPRLAPQIGRFLAYAVPFGDFSLGNLGARRLATAYRAYRAQPRELESAACIEGSAQIVRTGTRTTCPQSPLAFGVSASILNSCAVLASVHAAVWRRISAQTIAIATAAPAASAAASE